MLADRPDAQTQARSEQHDVRQDEKDQGDVHDHVLLEQDLAEERDLVERRDVDVGEQLAVADVAHILHAIDPVDEEHGQARGEDVDRDAAHDLVRAEPDGDHRVDQCHRSAGDHRDEGGQPRVVQLQVGDDGEEGAGQHHAFHRDVDHAAPL